ncbi:uncharacterized protein [Apostichopus japonicus]|uniref:uncharacterized protein isoform X4 n=1 Tax=Stichopus japonicus TaxID=307972 RepID=UPI003AB311C4
MNNIHHFICVRDTPSVRIIEENDVDMEVFGSMSEEDLKEIGITSFGVRRKLYIAIQQCKTDKEEDHFFCCKDSEPSDLDSSSVSQWDPQEEASVSGSGPSASSTPCKKMRSVSPIMNFGLKEMMLKHSEGKVLAKQLEDAEVLTDQCRRTLIRLTVACLIEKTGDLYPSSEQKTLLAKEIIATFPSVKDTTQGMKGYEQFYANGQGFIEYRLKNLRSTRPKEEKRRTRKRQPSSQPLPAEEEEDHSNDQELAEMVNWMKYTPPLQDNKNRHRETFKDTFTYRRRMLGQQNLTITEMLKQFPRMQDMPELINVEFDLMYPEKSQNFLTKWDAYFKKRIIAVGKKFSTAVALLINSFDECDKDICAISALIYMLHRSVNMKRSSYGKLATSRSGAVLYFIQNIPEGTDVEVAARERNVYRQPFILSVGHETGHQQYFIVADKMAIPAGENIVEAADMLFKCHYVFNVEYAPPLQQFWEFLASVIYEVLPPTEVKSLVRSLATSVRAVSFQ